MDFSRLTPRELEVCKLLACGYSNSVIARTLCIQVTTLRNHLNSIYEKLSLTNEEGFAPRTKVAVEYTKRYSLSIGPFRH